MLYITPLTARRQPAGQHTGKRRTPGDNLASEPRQKANRPSTAPSSRLIPSERSVAPSPPLRTRVNGWQPRARPPVPSGNQLYWQTPVPATCRAPRSALLVPKPMPSSRAGTLSVWAARKSPLFSSFRSQRGIEKRKKSSNKQNSRHYRKQLPSTERRNPSLHLQHQRFLTSPAQRLH
jgi:hypothetical protein